jgi:hypothetical protein
MDGREYVRHRGIVRVCHRIRFRRSFIIYPQVHAILHSFDTFNVDHVVIRVQNTLGMRHGKRISQVRRRVVLRIRQWSGTNNVCRACITQVTSRRRPHQVSRSSPSRRCGFIDDAVLDAQHIWR